MRLRYFPLALVGLVSLGSGAAHLQAQTPEERLLAYQLANYEAFLKEQEEAARKAAEEAEAQARLREEFNRNLEQKVQKAKQQRQPIPLFAQKVEKEIVRDGEKVKESIPLLSLPNTPQQPWLIRAVMEPMDEGFRPFIYLKGADGIFKGLPFDGVWKANTEGKTAITFHRALRPDVALDILQYSRFDAFPSLDPAYIQGYMEGLKAQYTDKIKLLNETAALEYSGAFAFDQPTKAVDYILTLPKQPPVQIRDMFFILNDYLVMARFSSPPELFNANADEFYQFLAWFAPANSFPE